MLFLNIITVLFKNSFLSPLWTLKDDTFKTLVKNVLFDYTSILSKLYESVWIKIHNQTISVALFIEASVLLVFWTLNPVWLPCYLMWYPFLPAMILSFQRTLTFLKSNRSLDLFFVIEILLFFFLPSLIIPTVKLSHNQVVSGKVKSPTFLIYYLK